MQSMLKFLLDLLRKVAYNMEAAKMAEISTTTNAWGSECLPPLWTEPGERSTLWGIKKNRRRPLLSSLLSYGGVPLDALTAAHEPCELWRGLPHPRSHTMTPIPL